MVRNALKNGQSWCSAVICRKRSAFDMQFNLIVVSIGLKTCGKRRRVKNNNMSKWQKSNFARAALFVYSFLYRCFERLQRETSRNVLVTCSMEGMSYVLSFFFFTAAHFHLALVAASISHFLTTATKISWGALKKLKYESAWDGRQKVHGNNLLGAGSRIN